MDTHSNIHDLHEHREDTEAFAREHKPRSETRARAAALKPAAAVEFGSGWYHEAAIEASQRGTIEARCHPMHW